MFRSLLKMISPSLDRSIVNQPLLSQQELIELQLWANTHALQNKHYLTTRNRIVGERDSVKPGQGLDFEQNRLYQIGDDIRHINWRLTARLQDTFVKQFSEMQKSMLFIYMDTSETMRFGTRKRTKCAQAARLAIYCSHFANLLNYNVLGLVANNNSSSPALSHAAYDESVNLFNAALPPATVSSGQLNHLSRLEELTHFMVSGGQLIIVSDFLFLQEFTQSEYALLCRLLESYSILTLRIIDTIEFKLPEHGTYHLLDTSDGQARILNLDNAESRKLHSKKCDESMAIITERLRGISSAQLSVMANSHRIDKEINHELLTLL